VVAWRHLVAAAAVATAAGCLVFCSLVSSCWWLASRPVNVAWRTRTGMAVVSSIVVVCMRPTISTCAVVAACGCVSCHMRCLCNQTSCSACAGLHLHLHACSGPCTHRVCSGWRKVARTRLCMVCALLLQSACCRLLGCVNAVCCICFD
jgi:hypothetical protein